MILSTKFQNSLQVSQALPNMIKRLSANQLLRIYVFFLFALFVATIGFKQYHLLYGLHYPDFDLGIFTQGVYKLSQFESPFVTIRGVHLFGDHFTLVNLIFVPFFWFVPGPLVLLFGQTLVLGLSGVVLYKICKFRIKSPLLIGCVVTLFYFYPALLHLSLRQYHPNTFAVLFGLLFWLGFEKKSRTLALVACLGLFLTKENMPLLAGGLAFYMWTIKRWRFGFHLWVSSIIAFILILKIFIPYFNELTNYPFANRTLGSLIGWLSGESPFSLFLENSVLRAENVQYLVGLFLPVLFLPLLRPGAILLNPLFLLNLITDWPYAHSINYQYTAGIIATIMIATVEAVSTLESRFYQSGRSATLSFFAIPLSLVLLIYINIEMLAPAYLRFRDVFSGTPAIEHAIKEDIEQILAKIKDEPVSVHYLLLPQFATRDFTFMWPNPYRNSSFGYRFTESHEIKPEYLVWIDSIEFDNQGRETLNTWGFNKVAEYRRLHLYRRASGGKKREPPTISLTDDTFSLLTWKRSSWDSVAGGSEWGFEDNIFHLTNSKDADQKIVKLVTIEPNQTLKFEAEIKTSNVRGGNAGAFICILDTYWDSEMIRGTTDWQLVELVIVNDTAEEKQIPFCLRLGHYGALVSGEAWFRNVTFYPIQKKQWDKFDIIHRLK